MSTLRLMLRSGIVARSGGVLLVALLFVGCDPGYQYRPEEWKTVEQHVGQWSTSIHDVEFRFHGLGGLAGSQGVSPEFEIHNRTDRIFVLDRAELVTAAGRLLGRLPNDGAIDARTVKPHATDRIAVLWTFDQPALTVLGISPEMILHFRLSGEPKSLTITFAKVH